MKDIKRSGCFLFAVVASMMATSCMIDEIIGEAPIESIESEVIAFGASLDWSDNEHLATKSGAESYGNRIGNRIMSIADSSKTLPMGIYVQDGFPSNPESVAPATKGSMISSKDGISDFAVWANYKNPNNEIIEYFSNVQYKKADDGIFYPVNNAEEYYWPGNGTLSFYALANAPEEALTLNMESGILKSFSYTVPSDPVNQGDILLATASAAGNSNTSVPLKFDHIMSAVNIKVGSIAKGEIRSITLKNVYNKGTYHVEQGVWVVDKNSVSDFSVMMDGGKFVSTGTQAEGTPINTSDATFIFIPQNPGDNAEMVIEFYDSHTGHLYSDDASKNPYKPALRGSIAGDNWDKGKTTNYMLSIDESYTMTIEPVGKKLDAHYVIGFANVTVIGIDSWTITATADPSGDITILPEEEVNPLAKQGFWTDKVVDTNGNVTTESARGLSSWSGNGNVTNKLFYIFIPENIGNADRKINLVLKGAGASSASTTKVLLQKYPNWTAGGFGWEVVDDSEQGKYGFKWTRKVSYVWPYSYTHTLGIGSNYSRSNALAELNSIIGPYNNNNPLSIDFSNYLNQFINIGEFHHSGSLIKQDRQFIFLNYTTLNNISQDTDKATNGLKNTSVLLNSGGVASTMALETTIQTTVKTKGTDAGVLAFSKVEKGSSYASKTVYNTSVTIPYEEGTLNDLSGILTYILKKNRYYLKIITTENGLTYAADFKSDDLKWYLPAYAQFEYFTADPSIPNDNKANYWSSTIADGVSEAYIGDGTPKDRDLVYRVIAVRKDENGYGNVTTTVDNTSLAGGENGSANNWLE
jgi:hypothetical protein